MSPRDSARGLEIRKDFKQDEITNKSPNPEKTRSGLRNLLRRTETNSIKLT